MKNDYSFKFLAAVILAGVVLAFVNPADAAESSPTKQPTKERSGTYGTGAGTSGPMSGTTTRSPG